MAGPTLVAAYNTAAWNSGATPKTASVNSDAGDWMVVYAIAEDTSPGLGTPTGPNATFGAGHASVIANRAHSKTFAGEATAGTGWSVSQPNGSGSNYFGFGVARFTTCDGIGANSISYGTSGTPANLSITTTEANSGLLVVAGDWSAIDGAARVWPTVNGYTPSAGNGGELAYQRIASHYTAYAAFYPDVGAAGSKTVGMITGLTMGGHHIAALEILEGAGAPPPPPDGERLVFPPLIPYILGQVPPPDEDVFYFEGWGIPI